MYVIGLIADYETLMLKQFKLVLDILLILNPQLILKVFLVTKTIYTSFLPLYDSYTLHAKEDDFQYMALSY